MFKTWICYDADAEKWLAVIARRANHAAENAERDSDPPEDDSDSWERTWVVAEAPEGFDMKSPVFPSADDFVGQTFTVEVTTEHIHHYRVTE